MKSKKRDPQSKQNFVVMQLVIILALIGIIAYQYVTHRACFNSNDDLLQCAYGSNVEHTVASCIPPLNKQSVDLLFFKLPNTMKQHVVFNDLYHLFNNHLQFRQISPVSQENSVYRGKRLIMVSYASSRLKTEIRGTPIREALNKYESILVLFVTLGDNCSQISQNHDDLNVINQELASSEYSGNVKVAVMAWNDNYPEQSSTLLDCELNKQTQLDIIHWIQD